MSATATVEQIPASCTVDQVCGILGIRSRTFYEQRAAGTFPIPEVEPRIGRRPHFSGELVRRVLLTIPAVRRWWVRRRLHRLTRRTV